jgi:hypothetical protein
MFANPLSGRNCPVKAIYCVAVFVLGALAAGCSTSQGRGPNDSGFEASVERETQLHGTRGYAIARTYNKPDFRGKMAAEKHPDNVLVDEFFTVRISKDPARRDVLSDSGYARKRLDRESGADFFELFDTGWKLIAYLNTSGELFVVDEMGKAKGLGRYQLDDAVILVYGARGGFSYSISQYDENRAKAAVVETGEGDSTAADIRSRSPRERGVYLRTARESGPVVELRRYRPVEISSLADALRRERADSNLEEELRQLRAARRGTEAPDGSYGGLEFKDGQPVDANGKPIARGSAAK